MNNLPNNCAAYDMDGNPIFILNGEKGYYPFNGNVEAYNEWHNVDEEAMKIMVAGSMFGWDIPAVTNYEVK
jgi:hypothetical protein